MPLADTRAGLQDVIAEAEKGANTSADIEKQASSRRDAVPDEGNQKRDSGESSDFKQDGVARVEAVTSVWTSKTMWSTFVL
jgi:hypothetical protein